MSWVFIILCVLAIPVAFVLGLRNEAWKEQRSQELIRNWAETNGYLILESRRCKFFCGPFFWSRGRAQTVYRVTFQDESDWSHKVWIRCGTAFGGLRSDEIAVKRD